MRTASQTAIHPQHGPALALAALLTENPDLPRVAWSIPDEEPGVLRGWQSGPGMRAVADAYAAVLGGVRHQPTFATADGRRVATVAVISTWRDVTVSVWLRGDASEYAEYAAAEAVAA